MIAYSHEGTPKPDRNPVLMISTVDSSGEEKQFTANQDMDDKAGNPRFRRVHSGV